jgi:acetolactate synthase-1/2/3 large subunit
MAALLYPKRRVLAVCGDGGFMMNSQELETGRPARARPRRSRAGRQRVRNDPLEAGGGRLSRLRMTFGNPDFELYAGPTVPRAAP